MIIAATQKATYFTESQNNDSF